MKAIIDTSSLLALVRYYLPFDKNDSLKNILQEKFEKGELIILDKVAEEVSYTAKGIVIAKLDFLSPHSPLYKHIIKTDNILPDARFIKELDNKFCDKNILKLKGLTEEMYDTEKRRYLENADAKIILYSMKIGGIGFIQQFNGVTVVTEETPTGNDNKPIKKIPAICKLEGLECCNLPTLLQTHFNINLSEVCH